ncbi:nucleotidyltransferase family protein [Piscinibacter gummiphilus]|uniref:Nucleotidyltransferase family protein n=1 Tax=Piscinibacter gummiphilus TaxID=946333 RepID=A0ABZ0CPK1_9BURK|nr:nucleotidyltransferase family protein [Piscinibacter gummiphilus]WOB06902.1 nucleotidyltransferase family protein [Piscinibacter gummiphilus]
MRALKAARSLGLPSWCIGAGVVRNLVWDHLHGFKAETPAEDIDFVFFEPNNLSPELERHLEVRLSRAEPSFNWEAVNQAAVHTWLKPQAAQEARPFRSLAEGVASWPEVATCVGISLTGEEKIEVIAPHGLTDLFEMVVRWNPTRVPTLVYEERVAKKRFAHRWPRVKVLAC